MVILKAWFGLNIGVHAFLEICRWLSGFPHAELEISSMGTIQALQSSMVYLEVQGLLRLVE